jgi:hypothetical protein
MVQRGRTGNLKAEEIAADVTICATRGTATRRARPPTEQGRADRVAADRDRSSHSRNGLLLGPAPDTREVGQRSLAEPESRSRPLPDHRVRTSELRFLFRLPMHAQDVRLGLGGCGCRRILRNVGRNRPGLSDDSGTYCRRRHEAPRARGLGIGPANAGGSSRHAACTAKDAQPATPLAAVGQLSVDLLHGGRSQVVTAIDDASLYETRVPDLDSPGRLPVFGRSCCCCTCPQRPISKTRSHEEPG